MIPIYIGYDRAETVAYHVLCHSLLSRSSLPLVIVPLARETLGGAYTRPRAEKDSTDFSNSRWIIPYLQDYKGWAIFMDCDMLCLADIAELWDQRDSTFSVLVKPHDHQPTEETKFLGLNQLKYSRKNWSSLMLMNCDKCTDLTPLAVHNTPPLDLHQFHWLENAQIGEIQGDWNSLVGYDEPQDPKLVHYTSGGPWHGYDDVAFADAWRAELEDMLQGDNPVSYR